MLGLMALPAIASAEAEPPVSRDRPNLAVAETQPFSPPETLATFPTPATTAAPLSGRLTAQNHQHHHHQEHNEQQPSDPDGQQSTPLLSDLPPLPEVHPHPEPIYWRLQVEQLEYRANEGHDTLNWEVSGWVGGDYTRWWLKTEGDVSVDEQEGGEFEVQLLHSKLISPFFEFQAGLRYDREFGTTPERDRFFGVLGFQGLAPYFIETDAALFVSEAGDISARLTLERELLLSQRWVLQPELEVNLAAQTVTDFGVGSGLNDLILGLRLRYDITRKFAPYVGVNWSRKFGDTAEFARAEGEAVDNWALVGGLRLMF
ncbi:MAG: copper resistance protein B [Spirulina sp. SIO3F2]|nr:copper resistance protein B [Spirulina sp. SIO3F2]